MDENKREEIALFRYGLIVPFLTPEELEWGVKGELRKRLAAQNYDIPHSSKHTIDEETIRKWLANYKANGFDGLKPKGRNDAGKVRKISSEAWEKAVALKKEVSGRSVRKIIRIMEAHKMIQPGEIKSSTLARQFHAHGLDRKTLAKSAKTFRRFEAERPNQIWQSDILYGPYLPDPKQPEKNKRTYLVAFIDDFSRLVPHAEFYWDEKFPTLENTFKIAMLKRGLPEIIYVDNGKVYHARRLDAVCASLGIRKISCQPYSPEGKGKVERFFRTVRENFLEEPEIGKVQTLPELNKLFWAWLEVDYQQRTHSSTDAAPLQRWRDHIGNYLHTVGEKELLELFLWQVNRMVNKVGLVSVQGIEFEVESMLHNKKVEVRYNPFDLAAVHIYYQGRFFQKARPAKISRWNLAAKAQSRSTPPAVPIPSSGIKPLAQLAQQHHAEKQQHVKELLGTKVGAEEKNLTLPEFIHAIASALGKKADAFHPREIEAMQTFFATYQPLRADEVGIAMGKAVLTHGSHAQHIAVYLEVIQTVHRKWQPQENKS